jgi:glycosyltransferase involved in cell wall biosynthesis
MRILLIGEYSKLHNSLKQGLFANNYEVLLVADGDGFKNYPSDLSYKAKFFDHKYLYHFRIAIYKLTRIDVLKIEKFIRFYLLLPKLKNFDVIQLINEQSIVTYPKWEIYLLKKLLKNNKKLFLLSCGEDFYSLNYYKFQNPRYSILTPYFQNPKEKAYKHTFRYLEKPHLPLSQFIYENCNGIIASDLDYEAPLLINPKYLGLIPNPINYKDLDYQPMEITDKIVILLGINPLSSVKKGIKFFEEALEIIQKKFSNHVEIIIIKNLPYQEYCKQVKKAHILLDQVFAFDQGYNALESMALGKVVFTGAEIEFLEHYNLQENQVCINALPDVNSIINNLCNLIENPNKILEISKNARNFIIQQHDYETIARAYLKKWVEN